MSLHLPTTGYPFLDGVIVVVMLPLLWKISFWTGEKVKGEAQKSQTPALPDIPQMWDRIEKQDEIIASLQQEAFDQRSQSNGLATEVYHQGERIRELELIEDRLVRWTLKVRKGVKEGTIPPYPVDPTWLHPYLQDEEG